MDSSLLLPRLQAAGARVGPRPEAPGLRAVLEMGESDPEGEVRAGIEGAALLDETDRGAVRVSGADAEAFLHRLLANAVRGVEPGGVNRNLLLTGKGRIEEDFALQREAAERFLLSAEPGRGEALRAALDRFLFAEDVELEDATGEHAPLSLAGPRAREVAEAAVGGLAGMEDERFAEVPFRGGTVRVHALAVAGSPGLRLDAGPERAVELWDALVEAGARPIGIAARERLRVAAGAALFGIDAGPETYPQEVRLEEAFRLDKGCYVGQEVVAKIDTYGGLNRRLVALRVEDEGEVARGAPVTDEEEREAGVATSCAPAVEGGGVVCLALLKKKWWREGMRLRVGGRAAEVAALPLRAGAVAVSGERP